jgi:hypothetical protein
MTDRVRPPLLTRREWLRRAGVGFGLLGLAGALSAAGRPHFPARAKRVIFLFMNGGPSHVDTFDPKPARSGTRANCRPA